MLITDYSLVNTELTSSTVCTEFQDTKLLLFSPSVILSTFCGSAADRKVRPECRCSGLRERERERGMSDDMWAPVQSTCLLLCWPSCSCLPWCGGECVTCPTVTVRTRKCIVKVTVRSNSSSPPPLCPLEWPPCPSLTWTLFTSRLMPSTTRTTWKNLGLLSQCHSVSVQIFANYNFFWGSDITDDQNSFENVASVTLNPYFYTSALNSGKLENFRIENVEKLTLVSENCFENFPRSKNIHIANVDIKVRFTDTSRDWGMFEPHYFNYSKSPAEVSSWRGTTLEFKTASWITSDEPGYLWRPQISCS